VALLTSIWEHGPQARSFFSLFEDAGRSGGDYPRGKRYGKCWWEAHEASGGGQWRCAAEEEGSSVMQGLHGSKPSWVRCRFLDVKLMTIALIGLRYLSREDFRWQLS
jgi:hypothetical protein